MPVASVNDIKTMLGSEVGTSPWILIDQAAIDAFAEVTGDSQYIHVDPAAAAATPFGGTVAHGFLTLSLLSQMAASAILLPDVARMVVNYGFEKVRFIAPVRTGSRVRGRFTLVEADQAAGRLRLLHHVIVEIEKEDKPALVADWILLVRT